MIALNAVTDQPIIGDVPIDLAFNSTLKIPRGRYALLARDASLRRHAIDLLAGLRPPMSGLVYRSGHASWPIGRAGFLRGRLTGHQFIDLVASIYDLDPVMCEGLATELMTAPEFLSEYIINWPPPVRFEFVHVLPLLPRFEIYVVEGVFPFLKDRFAMLWRAIFEDRIDGRTLILSTVRSGEALEYCDQAIVLDRAHIRIDPDLAAAVERYPPRPVYDFGARDRDQDEISDIAI